MSARLHVVFDGSCGFCTRTVGWVRRLDRHGRIELHASQCPGVLERFGLTPEQADSAVWAVRRDDPARADGAHPGTVPSHDGQTGTRPSGPRGRRFATGRDGTAGGAHAVAVILDTALGTRLVERVYLLPLLGRAAETAYRWVAEHRRMFPGVTPWCEAHPGQCGSGGRP